MKKYSHALHYLLVVFVLIVVSIVVWPDLRVVFKKAINDLHKVDKNIGVVDIKENQIKNSNIIDESTPGPLVKIDDKLNNYDSKNESNILSKDIIINLTNEERKNNGGLDSLKENKILDYSAQLKLNDMFAKQYFEHISPSGVGVSDLASQNNYSFILIGENLAMGNFKNNKDLIKAWMNSEGHKENILNKNYKEIGVAVGRGIFNGKNIWMAVQHFGTAKSVCPSIDSVLYGKIEINKNRLDQFNEDLKIRNEKIQNGGLYEGMTLYEQINEYNSLVNEYNNLIIETRNQIENYNNQITSFNSCISVYK